MENTVQIVYSGQEVQQSDVDQLGTTSGLADDHLLAEILRLAPYSATTGVAKAIIPYSIGGNVPGLVAYNTGGTVVASGAAHNSVLVRPFRAIVGSRNDFSGSLPTGSVSTDSPALANWRDIRSGVWTYGYNAPTETITLGANTSAHARWDQIFAVVAPDTNNSVSSRRIKDPTTGVVTVQNVPPYVATCVAVACQQAVTPTTIPTYAALPVDSGGIYYIPIAYVRVPAGATVTRTITAEDIRPITQNVSTFINLSPGLNVCAATGNNDTSNTVYFTPTNTLNYYGETGGTRPGTFLPPDFVGGKTVYAQVDNTTAAWSHPSGTPVDTSINWMNRVVKVTTCADQANVFFSDPTAPSQPPASPSFAGSTTTVTMANTTVPDGLVVHGLCTVWANSNTSPNAGLYVDASGFLCWHNGTGGNLGYHYCFWIEASGQFPNLT